jgi:hypothetical protein
MNAEKDLPLGLGDGIGMVFADKPSYSFCVISAMSCPVQSHVSYSAIVAITREPADPSGSATWNLLRPPSMFHQTMYTTSHPWTQIFILHTGMMAKILLTLMTS